MKTTKENYAPDPTSRIASVADRVAHDGDIVHLNPEGYRAYAQIIRKVCWALGQWCRGAKPPIAALAPLILRLLRSIELLVYRHTYSPVNDLTLDLRDGGFPSVIAMMELAADLQLAPAAIADGETRPMLKEQMLHEIFGKRRDPMELVWAIARRIYTRRLVEEPVLLPFSLGDLIEGEKLENGRVACQITWGYYDSVSSLPFLHHMEFEWSGAKRLSEDSTRMGLLSDTLRAESSRLSGVSQLAKVIDLALPQLHPKALRRTRLGPLRTAKFSVEESPMVDALRRFGQADDFALEIKVEGALSEGEFVPEPTGIIRRLVGTGQTLQRFPIDFGDPVLGKAQASFVTPMLLLPHAVMQSLSASRQPLEGYEPSGLLTYNGSNVYVN
ncbi:MAG TPA: hypothetical protein VJJ47_01530 [Candidatus Paceibacterota bacterium]